MNKLVKMAFGAAMLAATASSFAVLGTPIPDNGPVKVATPDKVRLIDGHGKPLTDWMPYKENTAEVGRNSGTLQTLYNALNINPAIVDTGTSSSVYYTPGLNFYGTGNGQYRYFAYTGGPFGALDDIQTPAAAAGKPSTYAIYRWIWNPSGGTTLAGTEDMIFTLNFTTIYNVDTTANPISALAGGAYLNGVQFKYTALPAGSYVGRANLNFTTTKGWDLGGLPTPSNGKGGIAVFFYTDDTTTGAVKNLTTERAQLIFTNMCSPTSTPAGTNPSSSGPTIWQDLYTLATGTSTQVGDYIFNSNVGTSGVFSECFDWTSTTNGNENWASAFFYDPTVRTIKGTVTYGNISSPSTAARALPLGYTFLISDGTFAGNGDTAYRQAAVDPITGSYEITDLYASAAGGNRSVSLHAPGFLRQVISVNTSGGAVTGANFSLINGDVDNNNAININDYAILSDNFNATSADSTWSVAVNGVYPYQADLDHNNAININDYAILSDNFNLTGDLSLDTTLDP